MSCVPNVRYSAHTLYVCLLSVTIVDNFDDASDFEAWNCDAITICGKYGNICGGYEVKATDDYIEKTYMLPAGTYAFTTDFLKIDSWFATQAV